MEAIIFCGIQASGKTTFYKESFFKTHLRISLDMLKTRHRENQFLHTCFVAHQPFVVDNTNTTIAQRQKYIEKAKAYKFKVVCYYFNSEVEEAIARNRNRLNKEHVPVAGIRGTYKRLQIPTYKEGFDEIFNVGIVGNTFKLKECGREFLVSVIN
jgi:predicted kinase